MRAQSLKNAGEHAEKVSRLSRCFKYSLNRFESLKEKKKAAQCSEELV